MCKAKFAVDEYGMGADEPVPGLSPDTDWLERWGVQLAATLCIMSGGLVIGILAYLWRVFS